MLSSRPARRPSERPSWHWGSASGLSAPIRKLRLTLDVRRALHGPQDGGRKRVLRDWILARPPGVLRRHAGRGSGVAPPRWTPGHLRDPPGCQKGGYQVGVVDHDQPGRFLLARPPPGFLPGILDSRRRCASLSRLLRGPLGHVPHAGHKALVRTRQRSRPQLGFSAIDDGTPSRRWTASCRLVTFALSQNGSPTSSPTGPPATTGFPFHDRDGAGGLLPDLARFLNEGPPPLVFTLGSSAASIAGSFFEQIA